MQIISISRGSNLQGKEFARNLADKLGWECISREDLLEQATRAGIPVGKLETTMVKPHVRTERLEVEMEHYKAFSTAYLCEKALDHDIVYHGRAGHLLLSGVDSVFRIRVVCAMESRIASVMANLNLTHDKAKKYIEAVESDRRRWVHTFYNVDWDQYTLYDLVVNLSQMQAINAAAAACSMARLPEFQTTPASTSALRDLLLTSRARLLLARNPETRDVSVKIMSHRGAVHVTYSFQHANKAEAIAEVLQGLEGAKEVFCSEAGTNVLWIQEQFDPADSSYNEVLSLANRWDAAIEILKLTPEEELKRYPVDPRTVSHVQETWRQTGIIDEKEENDAYEPEDLTRVYQKLISDGRAGGKRFIGGTRKNLLNAIDRARDYRLVILDNVFLTKSPEARQRMQQEWVNALSDWVHKPVISLKEIRAKYRFGPGQAIRMVLYGLLTAAIVTVALAYQDPVMEFLGAEGMGHRILATVCVVAFIPIFAFIYSTAVGLLLRWIRLD